MIGDFSHLISFLRSLLAQQLSIFAHNFPNRNPKTGSNHIPYLRLKFKTSNWTKRNYANIFEQSYSVVLATKFAKPSSRMNYWLFNKLYDINSNPYWWKIAGIFAYQCIETKRISFRVFFHVSLVISIIRFHLLRIYWMHRPHKTRTHAFTNNKLCFFELRLCFCNLICDYFVCFTIRGHPLTWI